VYPTHCGAVGVGYMACLGARVSSHVAQVVLRPLPSLALTVYVAAATLGATQLSQGFTLSYTAYQTKHNAISVVIALWLFSTKCG
jgi:hypothetical protein